MPLTLALGAVFLISIIAIAFLVAHLLLSKLWLALPEWAPILERTPYC